MTSICDTGCVGQNTAIAKEAASMINAAFYTFKQSHPLTTATSAGDITQYMNFVSVDTSTQYRASEYHGVEAGTPFWTNLRDRIQQIQSKGKSLAPHLYRGKPLDQCSAKLPCLKLHNGGILQYDTEQSLGGITSNNAIFLNFDPDGQGIQGSITFVQYANGKAQTGGRKSIKPVTRTGTMIIRDVNPHYLEDWPNIKL